MNFIKKNVKLSLLIVISVPPISNLIESTSLFKDGNTYGNIKLEIRLAIYNVIQLILLFLNWIIYGKFV